MGVDRPAVVEITALTVEIRHLREKIERLEDALPPRVASPALAADEDAPPSDDERDARPRDPHDQQAPRRQRLTADQGTFELVF